MKIDCIYNQGEGCANKMRKRQFGKFGKRICILFLNQKDTCILQKKADKDEKHDINKTIL